MEILLLEDLAPDARQWLAARHALDYRPELADDLPALRQQLRPVRALVVPPRLMVNARLLDAAPELAAIARIHDGGENIDRDACRKRRVRVIQATSATVRASAEYALSNLLLLFRQGVQSRSEGPTGPRHPGRELGDNVVALFGMTPAAQMLATMLVPLGVRLIGYDPARHRSAELWRRLAVQPMALPEMLATADAVSVQAAYAMRYQGLIGERMLAACKPGQLWSSISRAALFDWAALADALRSGRIAAMLMDSDDARLVAPDSPLRGLPNLRITPRLAPFTHESRLRGSWYLVDRIHETLSLAADERPLGPSPSEPLPLV